MILSGSEPHRPQPSAQIETAAGTVSDKPQRGLGKGIRSLATVLGNPSNSLGLPGVPELVNGIETFVKRLSASGDPHKEHAVLSSRLQNLLELLNEFPASQLARMDAVTTQLQQIRLETDKTIKNTHPLNVMFAGRNLEQYERLMGRVDHLVELLHLQQLQSLLSQYGENQLVVHGQLQVLAQAITDINQSVRHLDSILVDSRANLKEEEILTIHDSQITRDSKEVVHVYTIQESSWRHNANSHGTRLITSANPSSKITVNATMGYRNNVRVFRRSYNSPDPAAAVQCARRELGWLTKYANLNVAQLIGGFKTSNGLQEVVMRAGRMPCGLFLVNAHNPAALSNFITGIYNVIELQNNHGSWPSVSSASISDAECVTVDLDGRVTVLPPSSLGDLYIDVGDIIRSCRRYGSLDDAVEETLEIYNNNGWKEPERNFCTLLSKIPSLTKLGVMAAAGDAKVTPPPKFNIWCSGDIPPFTISPLDIGMHGPHGWRTVGSVTDYGTEPEALHAVGTGRKHKLLARSDGWRSYEIDSGCTGINWYMGAPELQWQEFKERSKFIAEENVNIDLGALSTIFNLSFSIGTKYQSEIPMRPLVTTGNCSIYFHRNPSLRSDPLKFWGFISSDPNPSAPSNFDGSFIYTLHYRFYRVYDDYGYRHDRMIMDGLNAIPGSYPPEGTATNGS